MVGLTKPARYWLPRPRELADRFLELLAPSPDALSRPLDEVAGTPACALTFDDGPSRHNTPDVFDLLEEHDAKATFFLVGERVRGCEAIVERALDLGHEVANHTNTHPHTVYLSREELTAELLRANDAISALGGAVRFARPPFGKDRRRFASVAGDLGLRVALWSVDSGDTHGRSAAEIAATVLREARSGSVFLLHDGGGRRPATLEACRSIVPALRERGLDLVTLSELVAGDPVRTPACAAHPAPASARAQRPAR
jgi:peptidoglycan/xylan/chitin deacetylase (PgdA/CDA1 family)